MKYDWIAPAILAALFAANSHAQEPDYTITLKDGKFAPANLVIPAETKVKITVKNQDSVPAEFESYELNREKVVGAKSEITVFVGPLKAGSYGYFDDFHRATTQGTLTAK